MNIKNVIEKSTLILIFFPFVGFIQGVDIQPFALLALFGFCLIFVRSYSYQGVMSLFLGLISMVLVSLYHQDSLTKDHIVFVASLVTIFLMYSAVRRGYLAITNRFITSVILIYLSIGSIQLFIPNFLEFLISRQNSELLIESGRGVKSLTSEPSVFGTLLIFLNLLFIYTYAQERGRRIEGQHLLRLVVVSLGLLLFSVFFIQSFFSFFLHLSLLSILAFFIRKRYFILLMLTGLIFYPFVITLATGSGRFFSILDLVIKGPEYLLTQGAIARVLNVPISVIASLQNGFLGAGFDAKSAVEVILFNGEYSISILDRNLGGFIEFYLKLGVASAPLFIILFSALYKLSTYSVIIKNRVVSLGKATAISIGIIIVNNGTMVSPVIWFTVFYFIYSATPLIFSKQQEKRHHGGY